MSEGVVRSGRRIVLRHGAAWLPSKCTPLAMPQPPVASAAPPAPPMHLLTYKNPGTYSTLVNVLFSAGSPSPSLRTTPTRYIPVNFRTGETCRGWQAEPTQGTVQSVRMHVVRTDLDSSLSSSSLEDASSSSWCCRSASPNASAPCRRMFSPSSPDCRHTTRFCNSSHKRESSDTFFRTEIVHFFNYVIPWYCNMRCGSFSPPLLPDWIRVVFGRATICPHGGSMSRRCTFIETTASRSRFEPQYTSTGYLCELARVRLAQHLLVRVHVYIFIFFSLLLASFADSFVHFHMSAPSSVDVHTYPEERSYEFHTICVGQ